MSPVSITVVTPCFNAAQSIDATIRSVIEQGGDFAVRYHIQDGGSTDGTVEKLCCWREQLSTHAQCRFSFASAPDAGMYDALNTAFAACEPLEPQAFMGWINADDVLLPGALAYMAQVAATLPQVAWVGGQGHVTDECGVPHASSGAFFPQSIIAAGLCDGQRWSLMQQEGSFWRASLWRKTGGLDASFKLAGDWDLWRRMAQHAPCTLANRSLGSFSRRQGQLSADFRRYTAEIDGHLPPPQRNRAARRILLAYAAQPKKLTMPALTQSAMGLTTRLEHGLSVRRQILLLMGGLGLADVAHAYKLWKKKAS